MRESILNRVRRCACGKTYYIGVDGDDKRCDGCIAADELSDTSKQELERTKDGDRTTVVD